MNRAPGKGWKRVYQGADAKRSGYHLCRRTFESFLFPRSLKCRFWNTRVPYNARLSGTVRVESIGNAEEIRKICEFGRNEFPSHQCQRCFETALGNILGCASGLVRWTDRHLFGQVVQRAMKLE